MHDRSNQKQFMKRSTDALLEQNNINQKNAEMVASDYEMIEFRNNERLVKKASSHMQSLVNYPKVKPSANYQVSQGAAPKLH